MVKVIYIGKEFIYAVKDNEIYLLNKQAYISGIDHKPVYYSFSIGDKISLRNFDYDFKLPINEIKEIVYNKL